MPTLAGCDPILDIDGAFFPAWLVCLILGLTGTALLRLVFVRRGLEDHLKPLPIVYASLAIFLTVSLWLLFYRT